MNTLEQMKERFDVLPTDFQQAIHSFDYDNKLHQIHKKHKLHIDQSVALENALADVIFGGLKSTELTNKIQHELRLDRDTSAQIAVEINETIILPLREKIKEIQGAGEGGIL